MANHNKLLVILGPTAVGKTELSIQIAIKFDAEIISADSRQFYRHMSIGTAKPTFQQLADVPHHMIDVRNPDEPLTLAEFQELAYAAINDLHQGGKLPILVGGTGQYVRAVLEGWGIPEVEPQPHIRVDLEAFADVYGAKALHDRLVAVDRKSAAAIDYRNTRRVIRALELFLVSGRPKSELEQRNPPPYDVLQIGLTRSKENLRQRVEDRIDNMIAQGLLEEIKSLLESGYGWSLPAMHSLGYIQFQDYFEGRGTLDAAIQRVKSETMDFVRRQYTWFSLDNPSIDWFNLDEVEVAAIVNMVDTWLGTSPTAGSSLS